MIKRPNHRFSWILLGAFILLSVFLTWLMRPLLSEFIVAPLLSLYDQVQARIHSVDPSILWGGFILIIYTLTLATFPPLSSVLPGAAQALPEASNGRLEYWFMQMYWHYRESHLRRYTLLDLKKLAREVISFREQCSVEEAESWARANTHLLPEEMNWLFQPQQPLHIETSPEANKTLWQNLVNLILGPASPYADQPLPTSPISLQDKARLSAIIHYLEAQISPPAVQPESGAKPGQPDQWRRP